MRAVVFIDGSNFYHRLKYLTAGKDDVSLLSFDFVAFCKWLCKDNPLACQKHRAII